MKPFVVGIADDIDAIHDIFTNFIKTYDSQIQIRHFYFATDVEEYLYHNPHSLDLLFLDVQFENSTSGIDSLPNIRLYASTLPIVLLTGLELDFNFLLKICEQYNVAYIPKPIDYKQIAIKIENVKKQITDYTQLQKHQEEILSLLANGDIHKAKQYLGNSVSPLAQNVLNDLEIFIESIKLCSTLEIIQKNLIQLSSSINSYNLFLPENRTKVPYDNEKIFSKVFDSIKSDINILLLKKDTIICEIIKWCAKKGYVQQAVTFYIEWLPLYLTESKLIIINDMSIIEKCNLNKPSWEPWQKYFLKTFKYKNGTTSSEESFEPAKSEYDKIKKFLTEVIDMDTKARKQQLELLSVESSKFGNFLKEICTFSATVTHNNFINAVLLLDSSSYIKRVLQLGCPSNTTFINFINKRVENENDIVLIILKAILSIEKHKLKNLFCIKSLKADSSASDKDTLSFIEANFNNMLMCNAIRINLPFENIVTFVEQYRMFNNTYRNKINHANNTNDKFAYLMELIIESVKLINI